VSAHRTSLLLLLLLAGAALLPAQQNNSLSEDEKRRAFLNAREESRKPAPTPRPRTIPKEDTDIPPRHLLPRLVPSTPKLEPTNQRFVSSTPKPAEPTPKPKAVTPKPHSAFSKPLPATPRILPNRGTPPPATITIEKSGVEEERGFQPAPPGGWFTRWQYLSASVRRQIDQAPVQKRRWRYIVVHNSGTRQGNAKAFDYYHLRVRKMPNGLAYHFVIGNGTSSGDGEVEIGNRWHRQINGGHVHSDYLNNIALGICLVGDFNRDKPTKKQLEALEELIRYLRLRVGKIDDKFAIVKAHREINPPRWPTDCPGGKFPYRWLHGRFD
jgi:hypothetical protein